MPEGKFGVPRFTNLGPLSRATEEEVKQFWDVCPESGKEREICRETKFIALKILDEQDFIAACSTLADINGGSCGSVAEFVYRRVDGVEIWEIGNGDHFWIHYQGKHYDAEAPTGVNEWRRLPIFENRIQPSIILEMTIMDADQIGIERPDTIEDIVKRGVGQDRVNEMK